LGRILHDVLATHFESKTGNSEEEKECIIKSFLLLV
jgi:hypothetical protein